MACSAGSNASSRTQTSVSLPAKFERARVGPRPNCSLCNETIAFDTAIKTFELCSSRCGSLTAQLSMKLSRPTVRVTSKTRCTAGGPGTKAIENPS
jgi:hypothetical protein